MRLHGKKGYLRLIGAGLGCLCMLGCGKPSPSPHDKKAAADVAPSAMMVPVAPGEIAPAAPVVSNAVQEKLQPPVAAAAAGAAFNPYAAMNEVDLKAEIARLDMQIKSNLTVVVTNVAGVPARPSAYAQDCARDLIRKKVMAETVWRIRAGGASGGVRRQ